MNEHTSIVMEYVSTEHFNLVLDSLIKVLKKL